jgi:hypothetical protein
MNPTNPKAFPGDRVAFENARRRHKPTEFGKVLRTQTYWIKPWLQNHMYTIRLDRKTPSGHPIEMDVQHKRLIEVFTK